MTPRSAAASSILAALLAISSPAAAQTQPAQPNASPPAAQPGASAGPAASEEEAGYVPEDEAAEEAPAASKPSASSAPSAASLKANARPRDSNRSGRVLTEVLIGFLGWTLGGYAGSGVGSNFVPRSSYYPMFWATSFGWMIGSSLALPLGIALGGALWQAKGELLPVFLSALIGLGVQLGIGLVLQLNNELNYSWLPFIELGAGIVTMVAGIVGYEKSHAKALRSAVPVVRPLWFKGGGGVALAWAI